MAAAIYSTQNESGIDINNVFSLSTGTPEYPAPPFLPGTLAWGTDGSSWVYSTASITIAAGSLVSFSLTAGSWSVALVTSTTAAAGAAGTSKLGTLLGVVGGSQGSLVVPAPSGSVTGTYFWVQRSGNVPKLLTANSINANVLLHTSAVGGLVGTSSSSATVQVAGIVFSQTAAASATGYTAVANYPTISIND